MPLTTSASIITCAQRGRSRASYPEFAKKMSMRREAVFSLASSPGGRVQVEQEIRPSLLSFCSTHWAPSYHVDQLLLRGRPWDLNIL